MKQNKTGTEYPRLAYTVTQAAEAVGISRPTLYEWMRLDGFPVVRIGGTVRIPVDSFREWLNERAVG